MTSQHESCCRKVLPQESLNFYIEIFRLDLGPSKKALVRIVVFQKSTLYPDEGLIFLYMTSQHESCYRKVLPQGSLNFYIEMFRLGLGLSKKALVRIVVFQNSTFYPDE